MVVLATPSAVQQTGPGGVFLLDPYGTGTLDGWRAERPAVSAKPRKNWCFLMKARVARSATGPRQKAKS